MRDFVYSLNRTDSVLFKLCKEKGSLKLMTSLKYSRTGIFLSLCISFLLSIYAPLELYFYNLDDFWFNFSTMLPVCIFLFFGIWVSGSLVFILIRKLSKQAYKALLLFAFIGFISTYIQGTFLIKNLPPMDGTNIDWTLYRLENIKTITLWVIVSIFCTIVIKTIKIEYFTKIIDGVSAFFTLILLLSIISVGMLTGGYQNKDVMTITNKDEFEYSKDTNFIIFILDAVDAGTLSELMETENEIKDAFQDFTYYENVMCVYPFTKYSIPFIISGEWYLNDESPLNYFREAIANAPLLSMLEKDYKMGIYSDSISVVTDGNENRFTNMLQDYGNISSYWYFAKGIMKLSGVRYAPYPVKQKCYNALEQLNEAHELDETVEESQIFSWNNQLFYKELKDQDIVLTEQKVFKLIHLEGAHVPYQYNKKVEKIENGTYEGNVEASVTIASEYLRKLKKDNVYDNAIIIVMADHGYSINGLSGRQHPILFIKGIDEHHEMKISEAPISYTDLQDAYKQLLNGKLGEDVFIWAEGDVRQRRYILYDYEEEEIMEEYVSDGFAGDTDKLQATGEVYNR